MATVSTSDITNMGGAIDFKQFKTFLASKLLDAGGFANSGQARQNWND